jgi:hypothetical protein
MSPAKAIWLVVLSFDTSSGRISTGLSITHDTTTAPMIMMSRDTTMIAMEAGIGDAIAERDVARTNLRTLYKLFGSRAVMKNNYFNRFLGARVGLARRTR